MAAMAFHSREPHYHNHYRLVFNYFTQHACSVLFHAGVSDNYIITHFPPHYCDIAIWNTTLKYISFNKLKRRKNGRHFPDNIFKWIFFNENVWISINISLKFVPRGPINNIPTLVQVMARRRPGDKSLSEPMMVRLPTHKGITRPQWVNENIISNEMMPPNYPQYLMGD